MKRKLLTLAIWLLVCPFVWAAGEIQYIAPSLTAQTLYAKVRAGAGHADVGKYWNTTTTAWATLTTTASDFDIAMTEVSTTGFFQGTMPATATGPVVIEVWQDADDNGTPVHASDIQLSETYAYWNGTLLGDNLVGIVGNATAGTNLGDMLDESGASGVDLALESIAVVEPSGTAVTIASIGGNGNGFAVSGNGTGHGVFLTSGSGATGDGFRAISAATNGNGFASIATGTGLAFLGLSADLTTVKAKTDRSGNTSSRSASFHASGAPRLSVERSTGTGTSTDSRSTALP